MLLLERLHVDIISSKKELFLEAPAPTGAGIATNIILQYPSLSDNSSATSRDSFDQQISRLVGVVLGVATGGADLHNDTAKLSIRYIDLILLV